MRTLATVRANVLELFRERGRCQRRIAAIDAEIAQLDELLLSLPEGATPETQI